MSVFIVNCGVQSPLGTYTSMSAANVRAVIPRVSNHPKFTDEAGQPVKTGMAGYLLTEEKNIRRFISLAKPALEECLEPFAASGLPINQIPLLVGIPKQRDGLDINQLKTLFQEAVQKLESQYRTLFNIEYYPNDHGSGMLALEAAKRKLEREETIFCLVGGMESYLEPSTIKWLEKKGRLKCKNNQNGFTPGEAAGFCLLTTLDTAQYHQLPLLAEIMAVANKTETKSVEKGEICLGEGLTQAMKQVLSLLDEEEQIAQIYCDMNSQRHRVDEYGYSVLHLGKHFLNPNDITAPANLWGDLGAASAPLLLSLVTESSRKGHAKGLYNLVYTSSPEKERGVALLKLKQT